NGCIKGREIESKYRWVVIEDVLNGQANISDVALLEEALPKATLNDIAYVIFTSGSTGKPKGVSISHRGAANTIKAVNQRFDINHSDKVLALSELSFDLSVYDIFGVLAAGGTIVFPEQSKTKEPSHWYELIAKYDITIWNTVPQLMQLLIDYADDNGHCLDSLKRVLMSGDWIPTTLPTQINALNPHITVMSLGGATEGSIWSIWHEIEEVKPEWSAIPYGQAMPNQTMYVLNDINEHCPIGVAGEIHIGGDGVAIGYWNDEEKTHASFIDHPTLGRLYKTGDLGKWHQAGYIAFQGRKDSQVKLNGYRVELEEISHKLTQLNGIEEAITQVHDNHLVAYLVSPSFNAQAPSFNAESFKFAQHGINNELEPSVSFHLNLDEKQYRLRKSYREFTGQALPALSLPRRVSFDECTQAQANHTLTLAGLKQVLAPLSGIILDDKVLPKYLYPSGGSSYAIQIFISMPNDWAEGIEAGEYYYHPVKHELQRTGSSIDVKSVEVNFKLYLPAIVPLYQDASLRLGYLEMGHMCYLAEKALSGAGIAYHVSPRDQKEGDFHHLLRLAFDKQSNKSEQWRPCQLNKRILSNQQGCFTERDKGENRFDLNQQTVMSQSSAFGQMMKGAEGMLVFEGGQHPESYIQAGFEAQALTEAWYQQGVGSCTLGLSVYEGAIYALAIGTIDPALEEKAESQAIAVSLDSYINSVLKESLPLYMHPSVYIPISELPLTANGKLDRKALPEPELVSSDEYVAPRNDIERQLCEIWQAVLGLEQVGIDDNFFRIGGDSIVSIQLVSRLRRAGYQLQVKDIFEHRTIAKLSHYLITFDELIEIQAEQGLLDGRFNLLPIQDWFFNKKEAGVFQQPNHWNQSFLVNVPELDIEQLQSCIELLMHQHDMLRVSFEQDKEGQYTQCYHASMPPPELNTLDVSTCDAASLHDTLTLWQSDFNLEGHRPLPLWQVGYLYGYGDGSVRVYFAFHHLLIDTVSWRILMDDLKTLYHGHSLLAKTSSYRQWVNTVNSYLSHNPTEQDYWAEVLRGTPDYSRYQKVTPSIGEVTLSVAATQRLLQQANQAYHTEINDLLLTALAYALQAWNKEDIQGITLESHGRESLELDIDTSKTVGWFTTMYPVSLSLKPTLRDSIIFIKESVRAIPNKGIGFSCFAQAQGAHSSTLPLPPISFNYLGQFDGERQASTVWQLSTDSAGTAVHAANHDENIININGMVVDGALRFSVVTQLGDAVTQHMSQDLGASLNTIISHCDEVVSHRIQEYTPSDFDDYIPYELINDRESKDSPIFFLPPVGGGGEGYLNNLVPMLNDRKLVLFNNFFYYLSTAKGIQSIERLSIEALASLYILQIKRIQPVGPYQLIGWSFGGVLAFEIARQLIGDSNEVSRIVLIDAYFDYKHAMSRGGSDTQEEHKSGILEKYRPNDVLPNFHSEIVLFKASKVDNDNAYPEQIEQLDINKINEARLISEYYVTQTSDNHLSRYLSDACSFTVKQLKGAHYGWIMNKEDITAIADVIGREK
ncbi:condensation domain-containing protein, partial [uncultured Shewanella sp.]|uniref:condensation domain-containing protein n=2 Tax=uncultured Shewanella sp. TaxID=173975 RepID=UPI002618D84F